MPRLKSGIIAILISYAAISAGQADSLLNIARNRNAPCVKRLEAIMQWAYNFNDTTRTASYWLKQAIQISRASGNDTLQMRAHEFVSDWYKRHGRYTEAFRHNVQELVVATRMLDTPSISRMYWLRGLIYLEIDHLPLAVEAQQKAVQFLLHTKDKGSLAYHYYILGWYAFNNQNYKLSVQSLEHALNLHKKTHAGDAILSEDAGWVGNAYAAMHEYRNALQYRFESLQYAKQSADDYVIGEAYRYLGIVHRDLGNLDSTIYYLSRALEHYNLTGYKSRQGLMKYELAFTFYEQGKLAEAERMMNDISEHLGEYDAYVVQLFQKFAGDVYAGTGNPAKALKYYLRYMHIRDSVDMATQRHNLMTDQFKYQFDNELEKIQLSKNKLNMNKLLEEQQRKSTMRLYTWVISLGSILLLYVIWSTMRLRGRRK